MEEQLKRSPQTHNAFRVSLLMLGALIVYSLLLFYLAFPAWSWQLLTHAGGLIVFGLVTAVGVVAIRRGRSVLGIGLMLAGLYLAGLSATLTIADFGMAVGFIMIYLTLAVAGLSLPRKPANWAIVVGVVMGLVNLLLELYVPLAYRLEMPILPTGALVISGILTLIYMGFMVRQFRSYSLRAKLIMAFVLVTVISVGAMTFILNRVIQTELTETVGAKLKEVASSRANVIGDLIATQVDTLTALGVRKWVTDKVKLSNASYSNPVAIQAEIDRFDDQWRAADAADNDADPLVQSRLNNLLAVELRGLRELAPDHVEIFVTDQYGALVAATNRTSDYYQGDEDWWRAAYNNGRGAVYLGQPEFDESSQSQAIIIALPVYNETTGIAIGVLRSTFRISALANVLTGVETGDAALLLRSGKLINSEGDIAPVEPDTLAQLQASQDMTYAQLVFHGESKLVSQAPVSSHAPEKQPPVANLGWRLIVGQEMAEALLPVNTTVQTGLLTGLGVVILAGLLAIGVAQVLTGPITRLTTVATQIAAGDLEAQAPVGTPSLDGASSRDGAADEIGRLAQAFNDMTAQLRGLIGSLEERVASRTQRLELVATLSERVMAILDLEELVQTLVNQVKNDFAYYHAQVYLVDDNRQKLVMTAGTDEAGEGMKDQGHAIPLNAHTSLVARAARSGQIVRVDNVRVADDWLPNPLLPDTYSEMAVPIVLEGQVVGVLDVQQDKIAGLDESDASLLRSLANQVAVAIRNARLFAEAESSLAEARATQAQYIEQAWDRAKVSRRNKGRVQFSLNTSESLSEEIIFQARQWALTQEKPAPVILEGGQNGDKVDSVRQAMVAPIRLRNSAIGNLQLHPVEADRKWTEDELALVEAVIDQVAQAAEALRLLDESQERASRERLIGQISNKLRRAPDLESLMKLGVQEISRVLGPSRTFVYFGPEAGPESQPEENSDA